MNVSGTISIPFFRPLFFIGTIYLLISQKVAGGGVFFAK